MSAVLNKSSSRLCVRSMLVPNRSPVASSHTSATGGRQTRSKPKLPRLPIPDLHQTLQRYLSSLEPFLRENEARDGIPFDTALQARKDWANTFEQGIGQKLQERLRGISLQTADLDRSSPHNWLDDNIWLRVAYHEWRAPLIVNSNWWLSFKYDPNVPEDVIHGLRREYVEGTSITPWQVRRASWLLYRTLDFKARLARQEIYPETTREGIWFQRTIALNFNKSRIPQKSCDTFSSLPLPSDPTSRTITLIIHNWLYSVQVLDDDGNTLPPRELERRMFSVVRDVSRRLKSGGRAVPIGVLTADDRDIWAENLTHLLSISPLNEEIYRKINHSIIAVSLDPWTYTLPSFSPSSAQPLPASDSQEEVDAHLHNIRSSHSSRPGHNRWLDKPITLIVESNTRAGYNGEHSPCDALVPSIMAEYAMTKEIIEEEFGVPVFDAARTTSDASEGWERLDWVTDRKIEQACVEAEDRIRKIVDDSDDSELCFNAFGVQWIKTTAKLAPDAFIQLAMQLAWYRTQGTFTAVYETVLTRLFEHGRTETIRSFTADSRAWVLAMSDPTSTPETLRELLQRAVQTHTRLTRLAATGKGIDRHLLSLRCMLRPEEANSSDLALFKDVLFARSQTWKLSTSGLSAGYPFRGTGFGTPEHDGYGISYMAGPESIKFGIESKHSSSLTSTSKFKESLTQALLDMQALYISQLKSHL
ncbi:acyltransferase ChoActase/COT/CPT [Panus rudis PR-1116 ss-1]|nr:acyltransferase ChoActase/COT/CPT [Panus rudis PR-1116 ss-1]